MNQQTAKDLRRDKCRQAMLLAASEVFMVFGFDHASMQAMADSAGVTKATLYAHFGDKAQLYSAAIEYWLEQLPEPKLPILARGGLRICLERAAHELLLQHQHTAYHTLTQMVLRSNRIAHKRWRQRFLPYQRYLEKVFSRWARSLAPEQAAIQFILLAVGSLDCSSPLAVSKARLAAAVEIFVQADT
ncbi:MAG: TetR/AcrR family transcriptional regulator [Pseudomonas sp.]|uniref:TetR/AcrR family transcriptional regulator n=1 Tax=Ectopseudomonas mendocina TaxID=300 RepID=UPI001ADF1038|nr:TetR/AcrR family transcriptional regulator [Pseudomonas mendocina]MBL0949135.1 TetR/AcrR family transcriptional regulator [Pseudomonas sp.]QTN46563.1 TetR/AcrR family transcriptional regulator [Pseudomonas mendocina]